MPSPRELRAHAKELYDQAHLPHDNHGETAATIRVRMVPGVG